MNDLALFTENLKVKHQDELQDKLVKVRQQANDRYENVSHSVNEQLKKDIDLVDVSISNQQQIETQKIKNTSRNRVLVEKQNLMLAVFDEAVTRLAQLPKEQLEAFFNAVVQQLPKEQQYQVVYGELTPVQWELPSNMTLSNDTIPQQAGFVFSANGVSYNFMFQSLVDDLKQTYVSELLQTLQQ